MELHQAFQILEIRPDANAAEAKRAYKERVRLWHPDRYSRDSSLRAMAEANMRRINMAYEIVKAHLPAEQTEQTQNQSDTASGSSRHSRSDKDPNGLAGADLGSWMSAFGGLAEKISALLAALPIDLLMRWLKQNQPRHRPPWYRYRNNNQSEAAPEPRVSRFETFLNDALKRKSGRLAERYREGRNVTFPERRADPSDRVEPVKPVNKVDQK